jgi:hypothetical protein
MALNTYLTGRSGNTTVKGSEIRRVAGLVDEEQARIPHIAHTRQWGFVDARQLPMPQFPHLPETLSVAYRRSLCSLDP